MALGSGLLSLRKDPRLLKLPPYLSAICILVGVAWLLLLPLDEYSRQTYVSENALLPGQVHTYFGGSEHNVFRAYRQEVAKLAEVSEEERSERLVEILRTNGLKTSIQEYNYERAGEVKTGKNVYAVLQGPRADATEAMVIIGAWRNMDNVVNYSGVALVLTLARYFKRWSLWSKDIIVLLPSDSTFGPQAWVDAYHDSHDPAAVSPLQIKSGALQAAIALDYPAGPWGHRFDKIHIVYDGINGQLPNLDLLNTAVSIASGQMGIGCTLQRMWKHTDSYQDRLETMLRGMVSQAVGQASGPHSSFIPYHVDAITLQTVGDGWHDEMSLGRAVEGIFRSVNNLLEHLHQSFFFYLLMQSNRFVSIGTYLPSAMLIAVNFTFTSIMLWVLSGRSMSKKPVSASPSLSEKKLEMTIVKDSSSVALVPTEDLVIAERDMFMPLLFVFGVHVLGMVPLYASSRVSEKGTILTLITILALTVVLPGALSFALHRILKPTQQHTMLIQCFSLLVFGAALSTLATLNFSQALFIGLLASPLSFVRPLSLPSSLPTAGKIGLAVAAVCGIAAVSPMALLSLASRIGHQSLKDVFISAAWAWEVEKVWTGVMVWIVWWPAWVCGAVVLGSGLMEGKV